MLSAFFTAVFPVAVIVAIGYLLSRHSDYLNHPGIGQISTRIALPALVIHSLTHLDQPLAPLLQLIAYTILCLALGALLTALLCRIRGVKPGFYISTLVNPNTGNLGIPLIYALLGAEALPAAVVISTTVTLSHFSLGVGAMSGRYQWRELLRNEPLLAMLLGLALVGLEVPVPAVIGRTLEMLAGIALPVMLMLLGRSLASINLHQRRELGVVALLSLYRPLSGFVIAAAVTQFAGLSPLHSLTLMMQMAMPVAVMSYILTVRYGGPASRIAALTLTTLPVSLAVLVLIYSLQGPLTAP